MNDTVKERIRKAKDENSTVLDLGHCNLETIPDEIFELINLQTLYLSRNKLKSLPSDIGKLVNLQRLFLNGNKLKLLPPEIGNLINLRDLYVCDNNLELLPSEIGNLIKIEELSLQTNQLKTLPPEFGKLVNLKFLRLHNNKLTSLFSEIGKLNNLLALDLTGNKLEFLPSEFGNLVNLRTLDLNCNKLKLLPSSIGNLGNLQELDLNCNQLKSLPSSIGNLINLRRIFLGSNPIEYIPPNVRRMIVRMRNIQNIYSDRQNVHNHNIQETLRRSLNYILSVKPSMKNEELKENIISNDILTEKVKNILFEFMDNKEVHSILDITFEEALLNVYSLILENNNKDEIFRVLNQEMMDADCMCFTGRITRLVNVLNGFDSNIIIQISENERIGTIISLIREQLADNYTVEEHRKLVRERLIEEKISEIVIEEWLSHL